MAMGKGEIWQQAVVGGGGSGHDGLGSRRWMTGNDTRQWHQVSQLPCAMILANDNQQCDGTGQGQQAITTFFPAGIGRSL